ncbi:MAG: hypothetical protein J7M40_18445 [Planctomycetes bacterium]|nr:hypothetical protein [Planctomycetota bacterium]
MISRVIMDEFMSPYYAKLLACAKEMDMLTIVDTDGEQAMRVEFERLAPLIGLYNR